MTSRFLRLTFPTVCLASLLALGALDAAEVRAQRRIIGADEPSETPPPPKEDAPKKDTPEKDKKKGDKDKKGDDKGKQAPTKPVEPAPADPKAGQKPADVLEPTPSEEDKRKQAEAVRAAAAKAAEEAAAAEVARKEAEQKKLLEDKRTADEKRRVESRDQRLAAARKVRLFTRTAGDVGVSFALSPGEAKAGQVVEVRVDVAQKLAVADPRFGALEPLAKLDLVASVAEANKKDKGARYVAHPLDAPGRYGFHVTPPRDGLYEIVVAGRDKDGRPFEARIPWHVGVWPPPDFEDEEKNNATAVTEAGRAGRRIVGDAP
jgi:hypothetical protein